MTPSFLKEAGRIVVKVGASVLTAGGEKISKTSVERVAEEVLGLMRDGCQVVLVSSGAIACGMEALGLKARPKELPRLQACAAIGQGKLMKLYEDFFSRHQFHTAQVLLTRDGLQDRERYLNTRNTINTLLRMGILPVVNENDTVATEEIRFGDNDILSALVSSLAEADLLVILSDVDGFYLKDRTRVDSIVSLSQIDQELKKHLVVHNRAKTTGGMEAKLQAARFAMQSGVPMVIASGLKAGVLRRIVDGEPVGTCFLAGSKKRAQRKNWLAFSSAKGEVVVDGGAERALVASGRSLLPSGIVKVSGSFQLGDAVRIMDRRGYEIGRGLVNYSREEIETIRGRKTQEIRSLLGYKYYDEVIHRDNLVITKEMGAS